MADDDYTRRCLGCGKEKTLPHFELLSNGHSYARICKWCNELADRNLPRGELAAEFGVSSERIRQIEEGAFAKLRRDPRARKILDDYVS